MFRLLKSALPKDPVYPANMRELGYFINKDDEIRAISNEQAYFNFFLTKNDRYNTMQREAMNTCIRGIVLNRLSVLGLETTRLPLNTPANKPHIPILTSNNLSTAKRVIILFYEHTQDLGIFAHRVIGGEGGISKGSAVCLVQAIRELPNSEDIGIIIANLGQLRWHRKTHRAITQTSWFALPSSSAVGGSPRFDPVKNTVEGNRDTGEHVACVFDEAVKHMTSENAVLDVISVGDGACKVVEFFNKQEKWDIWGKRMGALAMLAPYHSREEITNRDFEAWLSENGRAYGTSDKPTNTLLSTPRPATKLVDSTQLPDGDEIIVIHDADNRGFKEVVEDLEAIEEPQWGEDVPDLVQDFGCPVYSIGEPYYSELMLPNGYTAVLDWFQVMHGLKSEECLLPAKIEKIEATTVEDPGIAQLTIEDIGQENAPIADTVENIAGNEVAKSQPEVYQYGSTATLQRAIEEQYGTALGSEVMRGLRATDGVQQVVVDEEEFGDTVFEIMQESGKESS